MTLEIDILRFILGLRGPRLNLVTTRQIHCRFEKQGYSFGEINNVLLSLTVDGLIAPRKQALARAGNYRDAQYWEMV